MRKYKDTKKGYGSVLDISKQASFLLKFYKFPHHTFGANYNTIAQSTDVKKEFNDIDNKFYSKSLKGFKLDDRWKDELRPPELKQFTAVASDINKQYRVS